MYSTEGMRKNKQVYNSNDNFGPNIQAARNHTYLKPTYREEEKEEPILSHRRQHTVKE